MFRPNQNQGLINWPLRHRPSRILNRTYQVACHKDDPMRDFLQVQRLESRQAASSARNEDPGSNTFLDLISDPFVAAASFLFLHCIGCAYLTPFSSKQMPFGRPSALHWALLLCLQSSSPCFVLDIPLSTPRKSNTPTLNMRLLRSKKAFSHGWNQC